MKPKILATVTGLMMLAWLAAVPSTVADHGEPRDPIDDNCHSAFYMDLYVGPPLQTNVGEVSNHFSDCEDGRWVHEYVAVIIANTLINCNHDDSCTYQLVGWCIQGSAIGCLFPAG